MEKTSLRIERVKRNMTQKELGDKVGVSRQTIHSIEKSKHDPKLSLAFKISKFFDLPIENILSEQLEK